MTILKFSEIKNLKIDIKKPFVIFLNGDLGAGKTTISKHIINNLLKKDVIVTSPTYTYYNKYDNVYHFDLYRLKDYDEFFAIGGEDIFDNNTGVIIVEWPNLLKEYYTPDVELILEKTEIDDERKLEIVYK